MKIGSYSKQLALSIIACTISAYTYANTPIKITTDDYPSYISADNIPATSQIPMEALWLHLNATHAGGVVIPKSFDTSGYWPFMAANNQLYKTYLKTADNGSCLIPPDHSNDATLERAIQQQGLDIYDGAIWQIALATAFKNNPVLYSQDIEEYKNFLLNGLASGFQSYSAFKGYTYNGIPMPAAKNAYLLKFISPTWDGNYDSINDCKMQWPEWSAVTGEEAWAVFIGPVQSIYLMNDGANNPNWSFISQASDYIQLGKNALGAIKQMQAPSGGVYRDVTLPGQQQNLTISLENNFSLYAGLSMFEQALKARVLSNTLILANKKNNPTTNALRHVITSDQDDINTINAIKKNMVKFFTGQSGVSVFDPTGHYFYSSVNGATPDTKDFAVDVQTWGATVIATSKKDAKDPDDPDLLQAITDAYGADVMFNMLQAAVTKSGYYDSDNSLLGVGYTEQKATDEFYELSGEWTFGAINAAIVLADHYKNDASKSSVLIAEAQKMIAGVMKETSNLQGSSSGETSRISYLYANKRVLIPFGWYSNKAQSTASTGWSLMVNNCFNPLELGGGHYEIICQQLKLK